MGALSFALALGGCLSAWACSLHLGPSCDLLTEESVCPGHFMKAHEPKASEWSAQSCLLGLCPKQHLHYFLLQDLSVSQMSIRSFKQMEEYEAPRDCSWV